MSRSIAFVTPWPPNVMGIGETCYALVHQLAQISPWQFSVYTDAPHPLQIPGVSVQTLPKKENGEIDVAEAVRYFQKHDLVIHQLGNSSAHAFQWPLLEAFPAVCHFHDLIYHHFWVWYYLDHLKKPDLYFQELFRFYPDLARKYKGKHVPIWDLIDVQNYPMIEPHVEKSIGCIVHSKYNQKAIQKVFPDKPVYSFSLHKGNLDPQSVYVPSDFLRFGIFGSVLPNKQVDLIFKTFAKLNKKFPHWTLTLVGPVAESCQSLSSLAKELGIAEKVIFLGKTDKTTYLQQLNQIDCCINIRYPSFGESSGVVTECLILGVPVLVADVMWYSELPPFVDKLPPQKLKKKLYKTLKEYFKHPEILSKKRELTQSYSAQQLAYSKWVENYIGILSSLLEKKAKAHS